MATPLADSVARALNLDLFEIGPSEDVAGGATVTIGQQIGDRLFVGFRHDFGAAEISQVSFEYKLSEFLRKALEEGDRISAAEYDRALKKKEALERDFSRFLDDFDAAITPPAAGEAPLTDSTGDPSFCTIWTLCGMPALNLPLMQGENGLPLGVQLAGARGSDARLLRTARWLVNRLQEAR